MEIEQTQAVQRRKPRWFQFSIRRLIVFTTVAAVLMLATLMIQHIREVRRRPSDFFTAVRTGDFVATDRLLRIDPQLVTYRSDDSMTPLQLALVFGRNVAVVKRILRETQDIDARNAEGQTALHLAVRHQSLAGIQTILEHGASGNVADIHGNTPLSSAAVWDDDGRITLLLLTSGCDPNFDQPNLANVDGKTPLMLAANAGSMDALEHLLTSGANIDARDENGRTALHFSMARNQLEFSKLLVEHGADLTAADDSGQIPGWRGDGVISDAALDIWWNHIASCIDENKIAEADALLAAAPEILASQNGSGGGMLLSRSVQARRQDVRDYLSNYLQQNPVANTPRPIDPDKTSAAVRQENVVRRLLLPLNKIWTNL
jgi:ankyrin repeat protein